MFVAYGCGGLFGVLAVARSDGKSRKTVTWTGAMVLAASLAIIGAAQSAPWLLVGRSSTRPARRCSSTAARSASPTPSPRREFGHQLERVLARSNIYAVVGDAVGPLVVAATRAGRARLATIVLRRRRPRRAVRHRAEPVVVPRAGRGCRRRRGAARPGPSSGRGVAGGARRSGDDAARRGVPGDRARIRRGPRGVQLHRRGPARGDVRGGRAGIADGADGCHRPHADGDTADRVGVRAVGGDGGRRESGPAGSSFPSVSCTRGC